MTKISCKRWEESRERSRIIAKNVSGNNAKLQTDVSLNGQRFTPQIITNLEFFLLRIGLEVNLSINISLKVTKMRTKRVLRFMRRLSVWAWVHRWLTTSLNGNCSAPHLHDRDSTLCLKINELCGSRNLFPSFRCCRSWTSSLLNVDTNDNVSFSLGSY